MRPWLFWLLLAPSVGAVAIPPALADSSIKARVITGNLPPPHTQVPLRIPFRHHPHVARSPGFFLPFGFAQPAPVFLGGALDGIVGADALVTGGGAPNAVAGPSLPPVLRSPLDERPTVEMTPAGVAIVRGPGSHHIDR